MTLIGVEVPLREKRPHWGSRQVRTPKGIRRGNILIKASRSFWLQRKILVLGEPVSALQVGKMFFRCLYLDGGYTDEEYLADCGVLPYARPSGLWNTNCLLRSGRKRLSEEEVREVERKFRTLGGERTIFR